MFSKRLKQTFHETSILLCIIVFIMSIQSCSNAKKITYFKNLSDSTSSVHMEKEHTYSEPVIQVNDQLYITVQTIETKPGADGIVSNNGDKTNSYYVDKNGMIEVPLVGRVSVLGQTTTEAKETIRAKASQFYVNPLVNVRFLNFYINVLGDVSRPGRYILSDEKTSLLDALAIAGDLTISGKRENVLLIREDNGQKKFIRFNLNSTEIFNSPYYFLKSGDVIYVEQNKARARMATTDTSKDRYITLTTSILSLFAVFYTIFNNN